MLKEKIQEDLVAAQKEKQELKVSTLRLLLSAIKNFEIAKQGTSYQAADEEILAVIGKEIKQRKESIEAFKKGNRDDMVKKEEREREILEQYLPEQLSEEEIRSLVEQTIEEVGATSLSDLGKIMGALMPKIKGKADGGLVSQIVREQLSTE